MWLGLAGQAKTAMEALQTGGAAGSAVSTWRPAEPPAVERPARPALRCFELSFGSREVVTPLG